MVKNNNEEKWSNENESNMETETHSHYPRRGRRVAFWIAIAIIAIVLIWGLNRFGWLPGTNKFQAVFLNNGQVYFGKLSHGYGSYLDLKDIYYLQITQPIQPGEANNATNINLVKLGNELHGPTDEMRINSQAVLFIENLRQDSRIVQAIQQLEKK
jgi:hypothetical protein